MWDVVRILVVFLPPLAVAVWGSWVITEYLDKRAVETGGIDP
jgi:hypothetical protein